MSKQWKKKTSENIFAYYWGFWTSKILMPHLCNDTRKLDTCDLLWHCLQQRAILWCSLYEKHIQQSFPKHISLLSSRLQAWMHIAPWKELTIPLTMHLQLIKEWICNSESIIRAKGLYNFSHPHPLMMMLWRLATIIRTHGH